MELQERSFLLEIGALVSPTVPISCGVTQGSVRSTTFFSLYMVLLHYIFQVSYQVFADDTQLNLTLKSGMNSLSPLLACLSDIKSWIDENFLCCLGLHNFQAVFAVNLAPFQANIISPV